MPNQGGRGEAVRPSLRQGPYGNGFRGSKLISVFRYLPVSVPSWLKVLPCAVVGV